MMPNDLAARLSERLLDVDGSAFHNETKTFPDNPGAYALLIAVSASQSLQVGRLGGLTFPSGVYGYGGSANGPGGIKARLGRHFRPGKRLHWHIDHLTNVGNIMGAWTFVDGCECAVVHALSEISNLAQSFEGFGASDCANCRSHLVLLEMS